MRKSTVFLATLMSAAGADAGTATGQITEMHVANHFGTVAFVLDAPIKDTPRCNESQRFSFDLRKPGGDAMLHILLAAKRDKYAVSVEGLNTCALEWKSENVKDLVIR